MKRLIVAIIVVAMAHSAYARDISKTYVQERYVSESESYEAARLALLTRMKREFAEFAVGSVIIGQTRTTLEGVSDEMYSYTMGQVRTEIIGDDETRRIYRDSGGRTIKIKARFWISKGHVTSIQKLLERKQHEITQLQTPREYQFSSQSSDRNRGHEDKLSEAVYVLGGTSDLAEYGNRGGFTGVIGLHENGDKESALDIFLMMSGSLETTKGSPKDRISTLSINVALKYVALDAKFVRVAIGGGAGLVGLTQEVGGKEYDSGGGQIMGLADLTIFRRTVRFMGRVMLKQTGFDRDEEYVPILEVNESPTSGLFYMMGLEIDL